MIAALGLGIIGLIILVIVIAVAVYFVMGRRGTGTRRF
jgi:hypothetical protein